MSENKNIDLAKYKSSKSSIFTGRPQGKAVRQELELDKLDKSNSKIIFIIPDNTTSFNPSFYLGLLFESYKALGIDKFKKKYSFQIDVEDEDTKKVLNDNLEDGQRYAINSLSPSSNLKNLFSRKKK